MRRKRVLALVHKRLIPPETIEGLSDEEIEPFKTEYDVTAALYNAGHDVHTLGIESDLAPLRETIEAKKPHVVFNLLEEFDGEALFDQNVVSYLELLRQAYTGCGPRGLILARDKALSKQILSYHRIRVPEFAVFRRHRAVRRPRGLGFPLIVKSLYEEASLGISQASIVDDDERLEERVRFIHERIETDAIAEQFIDGREFYIGVIGNQRLEVLPVWELLFTKASDDVPRIATAKVKHDSKYQKRIGITTREAEDLSEETKQAIGRLCKRVVRALSLEGYARIDLRMRDDGRIYVLEANPNPQLAYGEDLAESAHAAGIEYGALLERIVRLGIRRDHV